MNKLKGIFAKFRRNNFIRFSPGRGLIFFDKKIQSTIGEYFIGLRFIELSK